MPNDDIAYLLKFAPKEAHIDDLINGQLYMVVFFDFAAWVILVWQKAAFDRSRPDDSILLLICVLGRFDNEIVRDASERLTS